MLLVSFHGGSDGQGNLAAYGDDRSTIGTAMLSPAPSAGAELRGLAFAPDGNLWVADGSKHQSTIAAYSWSSTEDVFVFLTTIVQYPAAEALWHPFDFTFGAGAASFYASNQDTNVVARFVYPSGAAAPVAPALPSGGTFLAGTFVASACGELPGVRQTTTVKSADGGLAVSCELDSKGCCKVSHSVRGVLWTNGALYVADEAGDKVRVYGDDGTYLGHGKLGSPVHLLESNGVLFVTGKGGVYTAKLDPSKPASLDFSDVEGMPADAAGLAFDSSGRLYVAARTEKLIYRFLGSSKPDPAWKPLSVPDEPEFLLYVTDS
jgi:hypothetical protein